MSKQKKKNSEKRRLAKKRRSAINRKAQVRSKSLANEQTQFPLGNISARKLSEVVLEFGEPLINEVKGTESEESAIKMSVIFWNASLLPQQKALEIMKSDFDNLANGIHALISGFHSMFNMMYDRKQNYFSTDNRFIVDYSLEKNRDGFYFQVVSTPFKTKNST